MQMICIDCAESASWHASRRCAACRAKRRSTYETVSGWAGKRSAQLAREPICEFVTKINFKRFRCARLATDVDHVVPLSRGGADMPSNYQSLCHEHHSSKTAREFAR